MRGPALFFLAAAVCATAQTTGDLKFEVASVKPAGPEHDGPSVYRVGPGTDDPERIMLRQSMLRLLGVATGFDWDQISAPQWVSTEIYEVNAKVPPGTTKEQVKVMWQNLLAERFHLKFHFITKDFPVYELTVAKNGPKLRKSGAGFVVEAGFPVPAAGSRHGLSLAPVRNVRQTFLGYSMAEFCQQLAWHVAAENQSGYVGYMSVGRVVDKTGLPGAFDFTMEYAGRFQSGAYPPPLPDGETDTAPFLFDALRQQLGLQLEEKKEKLPVLVVDHVDRVPAEN
jgi:uncharacterized protein (TIGR03435 family)